jgi:beta-N-acetylhexosaminidase
MEKKNKYIKNLISKMSLDEKVGALLTLGFAGTLVRPHIYEDIMKYHCGGLRLTPHARLFGSYVDPKSGKSIMDVVDLKGYKKGVHAPYATASEYKKILDELQTLAMSRPHGIPLHFSLDQEGGTSADFNFGGVNLFPKPMGIRATGDSRLAYEVAKAVSKQSRAVGFNWIHSPVLDINSDPNNPEIYTRSYSDRVEEVIEYAEESCRGFKEAGLIATGKHFPGRGDSALDAHFEMPVINVDKKTLMNRELLPYKVLIEKGLLPSIMIAHSIFPAIDENDVATVSPKVLTGLLREELGFEGVITTDSMTMGGIAVRYGVANACAMALEAGADLVLMKAENGLVGETFDSIKKFVEEGRIKDIDDKVYRVLSLKYEYGLFNSGTVSRENVEDVLKDERIINLSKLVAKKSVLVARDKQKALPLSKEDRVLVIEQINKTPNDMYWHPGILFKNCIKYNKNVEYLETEYTYDENDRSNILNAVKRFDTIVITNFYVRGSLSNNEFISELVKDKSKKIIVVTNTPYKLSIPDGADNVIITFATSPNNIEVTAGALFGEINAEGEWPVQYKPENE